MKPIRAFGRLLALFLALALTAGVFSVPIFSMEASGGKEKAAANASCPIYPKPQSITYLSDKGVKLEGEVEILLHGNHNAATLPRLEAILKEEGISYSVVKDLSGKAAIILAIDCKKSSCTVCGKVTDTASALDKAQGYTLSVSNATNQNGQVTIVATDGNGAYYGVMSLRQLLLAKGEDGSIPSVNVSDYPDVAFRGYVEGFFGTPWSNEDRASLFRDASLYKMTTYIYAPKDDAYHRAEWRTPYPQAELDKLKAIIDVALENNMTFCWTIHPGADYNYTLDSDSNGVVDDFEALMEKFEQVYALGVRQFGIVFDDLAILADKNVIDGAKHSALLTKAKEAMKAKHNDILPFITVPTMYSNDSKQADWTAYLKPFLEGVPKDTIVFWTGSSTMSALTKESMEVPKTQTGVNMDLGFWWNYPVNDYCFGRVLMAPLTLLDKNVDNIKAFLLNPMSEADASKVAIFSGADYAWNMGDFDAVPSWERAIKELVPEAHEAFARFADNISGLNYSQQFVFPESRYMADTLSAFSKAIEDGKVSRATAAALRAEFEQMLADVTVLKGIKNAALLEEITPYLEVYKLLAEAGITATNAVAAIESGNLDLIIANYHTLPQKLTYISTTKIKTLNGSHVPFIGSEEILPLLKKAEKYVGESINTLIKSQSKLSLISNTTASGSTAYESGSYVSSFSQASLLKNEYIGIHLPSLLNVSAVTAVLSATGGVKLQYSLNGVDWQDITVKSTSNGLQSTATVTASYIRILNEGNSTVNVSKLTAEQKVTAQNNLSVTVSTNTVEKEGTNIESIIDGDLTTRYWTNIRSKGSYVMFDLGAVASIDDITLFSGRNLNFASEVNALLSTVLEVSTNGTSWTAVGTAHARSEFRDLNDTFRHSVLKIDAGGVQARYFRFIAPSDSDGEWVMYYEMLCNASYVTTNTSDGSSVSTSFTLSQTSNPLYSIDNSYSTYIEGGAASTAVGDSIVYDLGALMPLHNIEFYFGKSGTAANGFAEGKLQVSTDGKTFVDVATLSSSDYREKNNCFVAEFHTNGRTARYVKLIATKAGTAKLRLCEINYNTVLQSMLTPAVGISTNMTQYQDYALSYAIDGDLTTKFYSKGRPTNPFVTLDYGSVINFYDVSIAFARTAKSNSIDGFVNTKIETSLDGVTWTSVSVVNKDKYKAEDTVFRASVLLENAKGRYLRFSDTNTTSTNWVQIYDICVNRTLTQDRVFYTEGTASLTYVNNLFDNDLSTGAFMQNVKKNDTLIIPMTDFNSVESITLWQSAASLGSAILYVQNMEGEWRAVGGLSREVNYFSVKDTIKAIKLLFNGEKTPFIQEIVTAKTITTANYDKVTAALGKIPANLGDYTEESVKALELARLGCIEGYDVSKQAEVDKMAKELQDAIAALVLKPCVKNGHTWNESGKCTVCGEQKSLEETPDGENSAPNQRPSQTVPATQSAWWIWVIIGGVALAAVATVVIIVLKKKQD